MITELLVTGTLISSLSTGILIKDMLEQYFKSNQAALNSNIDQAKAIHKADTLNELIDACFQGYTGNNQLILSNYERYQTAVKTVLPEIERTYGDSIPDIVLMPVLGLFANSGWAHEVARIHYICVALERIPANKCIDVLLSHETRCLDWIDRNRDRILQDLAQMLEVMNEFHKRYFTTSIDEGYPNLGYVIGYEYMKYLHEDERQWCNRYPGYRWSG